MGISNVRGPMTVPVFLFHLVARQRFPGGIQQGLPENGASLAKFRRLVGKREYYDFGGYLVGRNLEPSKSKFSPEIFTLVLVVLGATGTFFLKILTAQVKP